MFCRLGLLKPYSPELISELDEILSERRKELDTCMLRISWKKMSDTVSGGTGNYGGHANSVCGFAQSATAEIHLDEMQRL